MCSVDAICSAPDSAHQSSVLLQGGAVDNIFCAGDEAAATVSPTLREIMQRESDVAAVSDMVGEEVSTDLGVLYDCHEATDEAKRKEAAVPAAACQ